MVNSKKLALTIMNKNFSPAQKLAVVRMNQHIQNSRSSSFELKVLSSLTRQQTIVMLGERYHWHNKKDHAAGGSFIGHFTHRFIESWPSSEARYFISYSSSIFKIHHV